MAGKKKLVVDFDYDFFAIAVFCHEKDYRLCWHLHKAMGWNLQKQPDYQPIHKQNVVTTHSNYKWYNDLFRINIRVIANRSNSGFLLDDFKDADYFIVFDGAIESLNKDEIIQKIRNINIVQICTAVNPDKLKYPYLLMIDP